MRLSLFNRNARLRRQRKKEKSPESYSPSIRRAIFLCRCGYATAFLLLSVVSLIFIVFDTEPLFQKVLSIAILGIVPAIAIWACTFLIFQFLLAMTWLSERKLRGSLQLGTLGVPTIR
jgi:hypothetical protein